MPKDKKENPLLNLSPDDFIELVEQAKFDDNVNFYDINPESAQEAGKTLYLMGYDSNFINKVTGIPLGTLYRWIAKGRGSEEPWRNARVRICNETLAKAFTNKRDATVAGVNLSISILLRELSRIDASEQELKISELKQVSDILGNIQKVLHLMEGLPTEIIGSSTAAVKDLYTVIEEIREELMEVDPYGSYGPTEEGETPPSDSELN